MFKPIVLLVSISIILFSFFALSDVQISDAFFSPRFLGRSSKNDERLVTRRVKFDSEVVDGGRQVASRSALYLLTSAAVLEKQVSQIYQHVRLLAPLFSKVFVRVITLSDQRPVDWNLPENVQIEVQQVVEDYGGRSKSSFEVYRRQWEEHYSQLPPSGSSYLLLLDTDVVGRIFPKGILESVGYLHSQPDISGIGFRTVVPGGKTYPGGGEGEDGWRKFLPERVPYAKGLVDHSSWRMGLYKLPLVRGGRKILNTRMVYLIQK